ncbi:MAG: FAD-dependent thymidylate synthase [Planctomycetota bacterium]|jgi:thymidylate synthase ThyX
MPYTDQERALLARYFSEVDAAEHADVFLVQNLPQEVAATLNGVYSRSSLSMRDNFLERLKKGLEEAGRSLDEFEVSSVEEDLLSDVMADKSGKFLKTYAIDHGHNSLREGSIVHLGVERVSQLVTRFVQRERRCSFEESSTRYISFSAENHWRDPDVVAAGGEVLAAYEEILRESFTLYQEMSDALIEYLQETRPLKEGEKKGPYMRALKAEAFDAARYLLTPAINTKWGLVADARTLADIITELLSHPLKEFQTVGEKMKAQAEKVLTTLLAHAGPNEFLAAQHRQYPEIAGQLQSSLPPVKSGEPSTRLLAWDPDLDDRLLASMIYEQSEHGFEELQAVVAKLSADERGAILEQALKQRGKRDPLPIGLEGAQPFDFEILVDFGAYRDIGRHRKGFQQQQLLSTNHGYLVPPLVTEAGMEARFREVLDRCAKLQEIVAADHPQAAGYVTPFAFLQRVRIIFDPRQLAYFIELRSGPEGHFAYRQVALDMMQELRKVAPLFSCYIRAQEGESFMGRMSTEQTAEMRRLERMARAGDLPADAAESSDP